MATVEELAASLKSDGIDVNQQNPNNLPPLVGATGPTIGEQIIQPLKNAINDPMATIAATTRGIEKSFEPPSRIDIPFTNVGFNTGVPSNLTEKIEGTMEFPVVRGAEIAARLFSNQDHKADFTTWKQLVDDRLAVTEALKQRAPGVIEGTQLGVAVASLPSLLETAGGALKNIAKASPAVWEKVADFVKNKGVQNTNKLAFKLLKEGDGPILDAIIKRPQAVLNHIKNGTASLDDVAYSVGTELERIKSGLGENVDKYKSAFVADPLKRVNVIDEVKMVNPQGKEVILQSPLQQISDFRKSVTSREGVSILDSKQEANLKNLEKILTPKDKTIKTSVDKGYGPVVSENVQKVKDIHPHDSMLAIKAIDKMVNYETAFGGGVDAEAVNNLLNVRRTLKTQIRGSDINWFKADEDYANFMELQYGLTKKLKESDSAEGFLSNIFGANKDRVRERLLDALNYSDHLDTKVTGGGDAFFRRLADIQAAKKIKGVQLEVSRPYQEKMNEITRYWTKAGAGAGALIAGKIGGFDSVATGGVIGGYAGFKVGQQMANPMRVINSAIRTQKLSSAANKLAQDLTFVHKVYGNDGIISLLDIVGSTPALNEIAKFGVPVTEPQKNVENKTAKYGFPTEQQLGNLRWSK